MHGVFANLRQLLACFYRGDFANSMREITTETSWQYGANSRGYKLGGTNLASKTSLVPASKTSL